MAKEDFKRVTRADVAKMAGVSETIVSYVVNNNRYVDKTKRKQVEDAIRKLNYHPNNVARALKGKNSNHIVFIADQITNEHFSQLISEMDRYAYDKGYMISLCQNRNSEAFLSQIISRQYDGVIISSISFPEAYIEQLAAARLPIVLLRNRDYRPMERVAHIVTGLYDGARDCVRHLVERGRKDILYIDRFSARGHFSTISDLRYRGFVEQMAECGLPVTERNIITGCKDPEEVAARVRERITDGLPVDAIFGRNDRLACIGMQAVQRAGLRVPQDIAVVGFDNSSLSQYTTPTLTTVEMDRGKIAKAAVEMLYQMIEEGTVPAPAEFSTRLIVRESS